MNWHFPFILDFYSDVWLNLRAVFTIDLSELAQHFYVLFSFNIYWIETDFNNNEIRQNYSSLSEDLDDWSEG